jgi:endonuclease III
MARSRGSSRSLANTLSAQRKRAGEVIERLKVAYPEAHCSLNFSNPLELLVATILSAQCTDARVNLVTKTLFKKYRTASDYANAPPGQLEEDIRSTGFYRNKAKSLRLCCADLVARHGGEVPANMHALVQLPGIGRKTANVILGNAYGLSEGVVVDTHVGRLAKRLGLTQHDDPVTIEQDLLQLVPRKDWILIGHVLIAHGRSICTARAPKCRLCPVHDLCPWATTPS